MIFNLRVTGGETSVRKVIATTTNWAPLEQLRPPPVPFPPSTPSPSCLTLLPSPSLHNLPRTAASRAEKQHKHMENWHPLTRGARKMVRSGYFGCWKIRTGNTPVEYKAVTTPRNFISLVSPFFSHLGIWSWKRLFGLHKELQLILQSGL